MTIEGLGEMFEGDSADTCARKFPLVSMGWRAEGLACADPGARTPSALAEILTMIIQILELFKITVLLTTYIYNVYHFHE